MTNVYKCPTCGAPIEFDGKTGKMTCEYCGNSFEVSEVSEQYKKYENVTQNEETVPKEFCEFDGYRCDSCGAEVATDEHMSATFCSFCGSPTLIRARLSGVLKPELVIPFKIERKQAVEAYKKWTGKGLITPSGFRKKSTIEKITGMYVPFWLYDYDVDAQIRAVATRTHREKRGNRVHVHTLHYNIGRNVCAKYEMIPADASEKMDDKAMDMLEPFDYGEVRPFEMPYLSGYMAEKYTYTADEMKGRVESRIQQYIYGEARQTIVGYGSVNIVGSNINMKRKRAAYTLMPVWVLNYKYNGKVYSFNMNGQTGKIVGTPPKSWAKVAAIFCGVTACSAGIFALLGGLFG